MRFLLGLLLVTACAGTSNSVTTCQDLETRSCACDDSLRGAQECAFGTWSVCQCIVPVLRDGGAPTQNDAGQTSEGPDAGEPCVFCSEEICGNRADDDLDGATDCEDSECVLEGGCAPTVSDDAGTGCAGDPGCNGGDGGGAPPP